LEKVTQRVSTTTLDPPTLAHVIPGGRQGKQAARDLGCIHMFYTCSCNISERAINGTWSVADKQVTLPLISTNTLMSSNTLMDDLDGKVRKSEGTYNMEEKPRFFN
jgi:hypothetical protein